jgi:pepF/M3 family oligoendopeptidase
MSDMPTTDLGPLPRWDLSNVFPGLDSEPFQQTLTDLQQRLDALAQFMEQHGIRPKGEPTAPEAEALFGAAVNGFVDQLNDLYERYATVQAYLWSFVSTDSYNTAAKRRLSEMEQVGVRLRQYDNVFSAWLGRNGARLPDALAAPGPARDHAFYLHETVDQSRYMMSDAEEDLAAELALSGANAWGKLQGTVCSQLTVPFERNGQTEKLPIPALQNLLRDPEAAVRRRAYEAELAAWETVREPLAAAMNGVKGAAGVLNRRRGRVDALHTSLDQSRIDRPTLDTMLGVMRAYFPVFRRYWRAKAQKLGHPGALPWWDLYAPVTPAGATERRYTWVEAEVFVLEQFGKFSPRLAGLAERAFRNHWIDAEPRDGKRGGAFCMEVPLTQESRVLCNFDGSLDQVSTIAHELGHAYHNFCQLGKRPLQTVSPMTLNETASTFCETLITDAALAQATTAADRLSILEAQLINASQIVVDISSRFLFEREVFERRAKAELSAQELCDLMAQCQKDTFGDGLDPQSLHPYMWAWKPHYYRAELAFYNYPYAFGLLFGMGLYARYQQEGAAFLPAYDALLASTGEAPAADLAARFGIDIRQPAFWEGSLQVIAKRVEQYEAL